MVEAGDLIGKFEPQQRAHTPQVLPGGSASGVAGSSIPGGNSPGVVFQVGRTRNRNLKKHVHAILQAEDFSKRLQELCQLSARQVVNPLFSFLLSSKEETKWRAVTAMGVVMAGLADKNMESARVVMRRLMWSLNDESGGIGWGAPESMGEIIACHEALGREYANVLISYIWEEGNYLEYDQLRRGAVWGIGRAAQVRPYLMQNALPFLMPFLSASDPVFRGLAAWVVGLLGPEAARSQLEALVNDLAEIPLYLDRELQYRTVKSLAAEALAVSAKPLVKETKRC